MRTRPSNPLPPALACALSALLAVGAGCSSSARYTVPAAAINTAVAAGVAASERSRGGCIAVCAYGTACNPATGLCEKHASVPGDLCRDEPTGGAMCVPMQFGEVAKPGPAKPPPAAPGFVPAPAPPPPAEASPRAP